MSTEAHSFDARANISLIAAFLLIVGLGLTALAANLHPPTQWMQAPWSDGTTTEAVAEFGD
jgi:hypothetical protein